METLHELMAVLDTCTEAQRRRFLLYALDGLSLRDRCAVRLLQSGCVSKCGGGQKKIINFFENRLNEGPVFWLPSERDFPLSQRGADSGQAARLSDFQEVSL